MCKNFELLDFFFHLLYLLEVMTSFELQPGCQNSGIILTVTVVSQTKLTRYVPVSQNMIINQDSVQLHLTRWVLTASNNIIWESQIFVPTRNVYFDGILQLVMTGGRLFRKEGFCIKYLPITK